MSIQKQENMETVNRKIKAGDTLTARSICDSACTWTAKVIARKGDFITCAVSGEKDLIRKKVKEYNGQEYALLLGSYSMAPTFKLR